jgi:hypothetical protein
MLPGIFEEKPARLKKEPRMAARTTQVTIANKTGYTLNYQSSLLIAGIWNGGPVHTVQPNSNRVVAQNDSNSGVTGVEARLEYTIGDDGWLKTSWVNPFVGSNGYNCSTSPGFHVEHSGGSGDHAQVTFTLT